jgi:DDE superfamily endonuclease
VFWIVDNGSSHRGQRSVQRLRAKWPRSPELILIHLPIHASWLNQLEICFSIVQRKVLTPNDFAELAAVEQRLLAFERYYEQIARPFETFTRSDLDRQLKRLDERKPTLSLAA